MKLSTGHCSDDYLRGRRLAGKRGGPVPPRPICGGAKRGEANQPNAAWHVAHHVSRHDKMHRGICNSGFTVKYDYKKFYCSDFFVVVLY